MKFRPSQINIMQARSKPTAIYNAVLDNIVGASPAKCGRPTIIPSALTAALATHSAMMQVAAEGEASSVKIKSLAEGWVAETKWEGKMNIEYVWRKTCTKHPEILNPVKAKNNEDRQVEWLTYKNIIDWTARAKEFLLSIQMAKDEPGLIREY